MAEIYWRKFDPAFEPKGNVLNALFALMIGENEGCADVSPVNNYYATAVDWGWLGRKVPGAARNYDLLIAKGFVEQMWVEDLDFYYLNLTVGGDRWLSKHHGLPAWVDGEDEDTYRDKRFGWIRANVTAKWRKPYAKRERPQAKPTARTTSKFVAQISYTKIEAAEAIAKIDKLYLTGILRERSAAGYKATITRRIAQSFSGMDHLAQTIRAMLIGMAVRRCRTYNDAGRIFVFRVTLDEYLKGYGDDLNELIERDLCDVDEGKMGEAYALTLEAEEWVCRNLGMPNRDTDTITPEWIDSFCDWVEAEVRPAFFRGNAPEAPVAKLVWSAPIVVLVSVETPTLPLRPHYTLDEAKVAHAGLEALLRGGVISSRTCAAYRAHVTRRIAR